MPLTRSVRSGRCQGLSAIHQDAILSLLLGSIRLRDRNALDHTGDARGPSGGGQGRSMNLLDSYVYHGDGERDARY